MESGFNIVARATAMLQALVRASRVAAIAGVSVVLAACGGGGGGGSDGGGGGGGGGNSNPVASFTATPTSGKAPLLVAFDASASRDPDGTIASYQWNFDGTATGTGVTTQHTYAAGGTFTARLTVTDNAGATATVTRTITVQPPTGELEVTVREEFNTAVPGALVSATVGSVTRSGSTNASGVALLTDLPTGGASVSVSRQGFSEQTVPATITANQRTSLAVTLNRIKDAAGGVLTTQVIGTPSDNGRTLTIEVQVVVVDESSNAITGLTNTAFKLPDCTPVVPDPDPFAAECVRFPAAQSDGSYTVDNVGVPGPADVVPVGPKPETDFAVSLLLDQSGSIRSTDPTGARLISAKAFVQSVTPASGDSVLLAAFADDNNTQQALINPKPLKTFDPFVQDGASYFDELDGLRELTAGGTPLYRVLYPEATDLEADPTFTSGLIAKVNATAPAGKAKAIAIFTDGDDTECGGPNVCREKRQRVVAQANASGISLFTIGLSTQVNFEALGELARDANGVFLFAESAEQLIPLYGSLGRLLSGSLATYKIRWTIRSDTAGTFASGNSVLGKVQVTAASSAFAVPFIVGIP